MSKKCIKNVKFCLGRLCHCKFVLLYWKLWAFVNGSPNVKAVLCCITCSSSHHHIHCLYVCEGRGGGLILKQRLAQRSIWGKAHILSLTQIHFQGDTQPVPVARSLWVHVASRLLTPFLRRWRVLFLISNEFIAFHPRTHIWCVCKMQNVFFSFIASDWNTLHLGCIQNHIYISLIYGFILACFWWCDLLLPLLSHCKHMDIKWQNLSCLQKRTNNEQTSRIYLVSTGFTWRMVY